MNLVTPDEASHPVPTFSDTPLRDTASLSHPTSAQHRNGFIHALSQETLYNRISANRRVRWHRQIGARLELGYGTQAREMAAELAAHFGRGQDIARAVQYLRYAGEQALQRSAYQEASTHFSHGIELLPTLPDTVERTEQTIDLCLALRLALHPLGEYERVQEYLRQAEPLAKA